MEMSAYSILVLRYWRLLLRVLWSKSCHSMFENNPIGREVINVKAPGIAFAEIQFT